MAKIKDLTGQKFGRLLVLNYHDTRNQNLYWKCLCDCGTEKVVAGSALKKGRTRSCGCFLRESSRARFTKPFGEASFNDLVRSYKAHAKKLNLPFLLSDALFKEITRGHCFYCGIDARQIWRSSKSTVYGEYIYNGIDRIDSSKGYTEDNVVSCCQTCNKAKRIMSDTEFYEWISRVFNNLKSKKLL